jgi:hypothetical protein
LEVGEVVAGLVVALGEGLEVVRVVAARVAEGWVVAGWGEPCKWSDLGAHQS